MTWIPFESLDFHQHGDVRLMHPSRTFVCLHDFDGFASI